MTAPKCHKCNVVMERGHAIRETFTGVPDFPGCSEVVTVSPGGPGKLVDCWKCPKCGHSISITGKEK